MSKGNFLGEFEQLVLMGLIHLEPPHGTGGYGAALKRFLADRADRNIAEGAIYTTLKRLETKGLVTSQMSAPLPKRGGRSRRLYTIHPAGRFQLYKSLSALDRVKDTLPLGWAMGGV